MIRDIYNIEKRYLRELVLCREDCTRNNYEIFINYANYCVVKGLSRNRIIKYMSILRRTSHMLDKTLTKADEKDLLHILKNLCEMKVHKTTHEANIIFLRKFFVWAHRNRKHKYAKLEHLLERGMSSSVREPSHILQSKDILRMLLACKTNEMRVIIYLLWETGARIGELLNIKHDDIKFDQNGAVVRLDGKTGVRYVRIVESVAILNSYIVQALFRREYLFHFKYAAFKKQLNIIKTQLGYKELYPHLFRKSRASYLAKFMTEQQLKKYMGWTVGSRVLQHYIFLTCDDANEAVLKMHGKEIPQQNFEQNKVGEFATFTLP